MAVINAMYGRPAVALPRAEAPWLGRVVVAAAVVVAFSFVGHSWDESRRMAAQSGLDANRVENRIATQQAETTVSSAIGFFLLGGVGVACWALAPAQMVRRKNWLLVGLCALYVGYCVMSLRWSIDAEQSLRKIGILVLMLAGAFGLARRFTLEDLLWIAVFSLSAFVIAGGLAEVFHGTLRPWRADYRFSGTCHPNDQGLQCALLTMCVLFVGWHERRRPWMMAALFAIGLAGLWYSKSRTTLFAFIASIVLALVLHRRGVERWLILASCLTLAAVGGIGYSFVNVATIAQASDLASMGRSENVSSLTGRLPLWDELLKSARRRPTWGHGYGGFWNSKNVLKYSDMFRWHIPHAHNAYLDMVLATGVLGMAMYVTWVAASAVAAAARHTRSGRRDELFAACLLAFSLVHGATESKFPGSGIAGFLLFCVLAMTAIWRHESRPPRMLSEGHTLLGTARYRPAAMTSRRRSYGEYA